MMLLSTLVSGCLLAVAIAISTRFFSVRSKDVELAYKGLQVAHRRARQKLEMLLACIEVAKDAWNGLQSEAAEPVPLYVLLEIKMLDQTLAKAEDAKAEIEATSKGSLRMSAVELRRHHSRVWKQITALNVRQSDVDDSLTRLRWHTSQLALAYSDHQRRGNVNGSDPVCREVAVSSA
jgi:hypothetical protein